MGPKSRYIGPEVPKEDLIWQDPLPQPIYNPTEQDIIDLNSRLRILVCLLVSWYRWPGRLLLPSVVATNVVVPTVRVWH